MKTIWKFGLGTKDDFTINMPTGAKILAVQIQHGKPCIWAMCDDGASGDKRRFRIFGTGQLIPGAEGLKYIGTFQVYDGDLVFHVFEETE